MIVLEAFNESVANISFHNKKNCFNHWAGESNYPTSLAGELRKSYKYRKYFIKTLEWAMGRNVLFGQQSLKVIWIYVCPTKLKDE